MSNFTNAEGPRARDAPCSSLTAFDFAKIEQPSHQQARYGKKQDKGQRHVDSDEIVARADFGACVIAADHAPAPAAARHVIDVLTLAAERVAHHVGLAQEIAVELVKRHTRGKAQYQRYQEHAAGYDQPALDVDWFAGDVARMSSGHMSFAPDPPARCRHTGSDDVGEERYIH